MPVRDGRSPTGSRSPTRLLAGLALVVGMGVVVVVVTSSGSPSKPAGQGGKTGSGAGVAIVKRRDLVLNDTQPGTLSYSDPQTVYDRLSGTITWLPQVGQQIKPGGTLFKVDGEPVILMNGSTPAYRDLTPAAGDGADILELNRNLVRLGFDAGGIKVDDTWQAATTEGVDLLQESLRETPTGTLSLGQVVFLPADQLVSTVEGTLGDGNGSSSNASTTADPPAPDFVSLTVTPTRRTSGPSAKRAKRRKRSQTSRHHHKRTLAALVALLKAEVGELRSQQSPPSSGPGGTAPSSGSPSDKTNSDSPPRNEVGNGGSGNGGGGGASPQAVLQTTSTHLVVTVDLSATSQSEAVVGQHVSVVMPSGDIVGGRITAVSPVAQSASNSGDNSAGNGGGGGSSGGGSGGGNGNGGGVSSTIPVTIALSGRTAGAGMDQAAVSVNFVQQRANHVLSLPVTALLATSGAHYAVQEAAAPHRLLVVTTGLFAAGYVQISGPGIHPELRVTDSLG